MEALPELFYHICRPLTSLRLIFTVTLGLPVCINLFGRLFVFAVREETVAENGLNSSLISLVFPVVKRHLQNQGKEVPDGVPGFTDTLDHHQEILPDFLIEFPDYVKSWSSTRKFTFQLSGNYRKDKKQN